MEYLLVGLVAVLIIARIVVRSDIVNDYERGVLYRHGKFVRVVEPGRLRRFGTGTELVKIDVRRRLETIPGQDLLTVDGVGVKASMVVEYQITDVVLTRSATADLTSTVYLSAQLVLRDVVSTMTHDDLLSQRAALGPQLLLAAQPAFAAVGLTAHRLEIKDIMLPADLKRIYHQVAEAKQEALAAMERARSQAAVTRSLLNTAKLYEDHPGLGQMRTIEAMTEGKGNTFVFGADLPSIAKS